MTQDFFDLNFLTKYSLEKRFATLLSETRKQQGVTLEQLSEGLCTESQLAKIEKAERLPARTLQKRLLERLGFELAGFENFLQAEEYEDWKEKEKILYYIEADDLGTAKKLLKQYAKKQGLENKQDADILNFQFYLVMQAQILEHEKCSQKVLPQEREKIEAKLFSYYETAVQLTVQNLEAKTLHERKLAVVELNLWLEYKSRLLEQILQGKKDVRELGNHTAITIDDAFVMYEEMLTYVEHDCYGSLAKAQMYPKIVFYMYRQLMPYIEQHQEQQDRLLQRLLVVVNRGIRFLQQQEVAYYLFELLESKIYLMQALSEHLVGRNGNEKRSKWDALQTQAVEWKETLQTVYTEYGISYRTKDCCYLYHEKKVYSLGETIAKRRKLLGFTQEALCDGICAKKTLVRLEKGEGKTQTAIVMQLLKRLHLISEYLHRPIVTDKRELLNTFDQFRYELNMGEYDLAETLLGELREKIEKNTFNEQALAMYEIILLFYTKKMGSAEYVQKMKKVLQYTVPLERASKGKDEFYLTHSEKMLVYHIAIGYKWAENYDKAYEVLHELEKVYVKYAEEKLVDSQISMYEFIMVVIAELYLYRKEYEKAEELLQQLLVQALKAKRLHTIHKVLVLFVYKEIQENILPKEQIQSKLEAGICICQICKDKVAERGYIKYKEDIFKSMETGC